MEMYPLKIIWNKVHSTNILPFVLTNIEQYSAKEVRINLITEMASNVWTEERQTLEITVFALLTISCLWSASKKPEIYIYNSDLPCIIKEDIAVKLQASHKTAPRKRSVKIITRSRGETDQFGRKGSYCSMEN